MNTNTALKLLALAILLGLGIFLILGQDGDAGTLTERGDVAAPDETRPPAALEGAEEEARAAKPTERVEATIASPLVASLPWHGELAGVVGRVIETDGTPVVGVRVTLLEFDTDILFSSGFPDLEGLAPRAASLELEETLTDAEGRFLLGGARAPAFHGLGIDLGGPRATLRVLDSALIHRERTDLGDVVLAPYGIVTGRVVDESGAGVSGARIRLGPFPEEVLLAAPYELRSDSLLAVSMLLSGGDGQGVIEPPRWIGELLEDLPVPTTHTDDTGAFRLEGVALARVVGGVDKSGYAGLPLGPIDMQAAAEQDLGNLVLTRGRTIAGVVEDAGGEPIVGVEVYAGAEVPAGFVAILQPCGATNADGEFTLRGVPGEGQVVAATRRSKSEPWISEVTLQHDGMLLSLESAIRLTVNVQDEAGEPVSGAHIQLKPAQKMDRRMGFGEIIRFLPRDPHPDTGFREEAPGRYVNAIVTPGTYDVTAQVKGLARGLVSAELWEEESEVVVTCPAGKHLELLVVDAATQQPVENAHARVLEAGMRGFSHLAGGRTDPAGRARLGPLVPLQPPQGDSMPEQTILVVRHPRYADHSKVLGPAEIESGAEAIVALYGGGVLAGRVHWDGAVPTRLYMLTLEYLSAEDGFIEVFHMPRFGLTNLEGAFRIDNLPAGDYRVELVERFLDQDPAGLFQGDFEPVSLYRDTLAIPAGETTELVIDLTPSGRGPTARLTGHVRVDGREIEGAEVAVRGNGVVKTVTDAWGRFETEAFSVWQAVQVSIEGDVRLPNGAQRRMHIYQESLELRADEVREIDVDLFPIELRVEVVEASTNEPISGARVRARPTGERSKSAQGFTDGFSTDDSGRTGVWVGAAGEYSLSASGEGYTSAKGKVTAPEAGQAEVVRLELSRSVRCAGRVVVPSVEAAPGSFSYISVRSADSSHSSGMLISGPDFAFELDGLSEGTYRVWIYVNGQIGEERSFELGPDGDRNLLLDYVAQR